MELTRNKHASITKTTDDGLTVPHDRGQRIQGQYCNLSTSDNNINIAPSHLDGATSQSLRAPPSVGVVNDK